MSDKGTVKYLGWENGSTKIFYVEIPCPNCGCMLHGNAAMVVVNSLSGTFMMDCPSCEEKDMLIERAFTEEELAGDWHV